MLNTYVAGNPGSVRASAVAIRRTGTGVEDTAEAWHRSRSRSEPIWEGQAADRFRDSANRNGRDADALADQFMRMAGAMSVFADDLDTVRARMEQANQAARDGALTVLSNAIQSPAAPHPAPPIEGRSSAVESTTHSQATAGQAIQGKQQAAFAEAQAIVTEARQIEQIAHAKLTDALNAASSELVGLAQSGSWTRAAAGPTSPAAAALAGAAETLETHSANATRGMFEGSMAGGPVATRGVWAAMTSAQRAEMIDRFPEMVGRTNGVPAEDRNTANKNILTGQRAAILSTIRDEEAAYRSTRSIPGARGEEHRSAAERARTNLNQLDQLEGQLFPPPAISIFSGSMRPPTVAERRLLLAAIQTRQPTCSPMFRARVPT